jgi:Tfp pilus assembly protein PilF
MKENKFLQPRVFLKQKIALVLFGLFLFFVLLEAGLRLGGVILLSIQEHRNTQSIKQKGVYRIICLGESTTQGQYPSFLEEVLNQRNMGVRFSVVDKGMIGKNTSNILSKVESYLAEYHPDMVVTMMGINDLGKHIPFEGVITSKGMLLIRSFRAYKLTKLLWLHILTKAKEIGFYKPSEDKRGSMNLSGIGLKEGCAGSFLMDSFKKAIELNPKNANAYVELRGLYLEQGKSLHAKDLFKKAIKLNPKNDKAYVGLGWIYLEQGKSRQAEDLFDKAIKLNPKNEFAYEGLWQLYLEQGKSTQAEDSFKKAIELTPENESAYLGLWQLYREQGKSRQAEDLFDKAIEFNSKSNCIYGAISLLYEEIGKPELAKEYAEKANRLRLRYYNPVTVNNYHKLKEILDKSGIRLVCVQYPMRNVEPLKKMFEQDEGIIFVDNESVFKEALKKASYKEYFVDMFGGDFGHCTEKGNTLLAENIANGILKEHFNK